MKNADCIAFLKWCLPRLGLGWSGYRKVRRTVCKRVARRIRALGLADAVAYRAWLEAHAEEWPRLEAMCRIPISRFWRDRRVFDALAQEVLPDLAAAAALRGDARLDVWSAGCASGEEPYSLRLAWSLAAEAAFPGLAIRILATEIDAPLLARARVGRYEQGSLKDLPPALTRRAFRRADDQHEIRDRFRAGIDFLRQDMRADMPEGPFDLILCRNLAFTYFDAAGQAAILARIVARLRPGGALVIGTHEKLPEPPLGLAKWAGALPVYRLCPS